MDHDSIHDSFLRKGIFGEWRNHFVDMADAEMTQKIAKEILNMK